MHKMLAWALRPPPPPPSFIDEGPEVQGGDAVYAGFTPRQPTRLPAFSRKVISFLMSHMRNISYDQNVPLISTDYNADMQ